MPLFDSDFLKKIEYLSIVSRRVFRGSLIAQRRTMQVGSGVEFADHRDYTPGDDFRYLDWNLYARHDDLLLKRFQEEEDLHLYLMLDCSRSMEAGSPSKFDLARQVTAALAYIALADLDRVAIVAFANGILHDFPLTRGKNRILTLLQFLEQLEPIGSDTNLRDMVLAFVHRQQRRGLAIVVSDLFDPSGYQNGLDRLRHHKYEPHVVHIYDESEAEPNMLGDVELVDIETEQANKITVTEKHLKTYRRVFGEFLDGARDYCRAYGVGYTRTTADVPFDELVLGMMRRAGTLG
ncbi:MAG: DUF58 domain-containing protein [Planctomycetota bacterium]|nr:MAG: DUF58 domain-containing protein [Planctomycetota bacterium]REK20383.1 MAG: DUF58 domain-containing protein [Planctomycetota bacterium]REK26880.1 MAG: DUF58 domain-containing protein [Planctomycetota bacterium]